MRCTKCGLVNPDGTSKCQACGEKLGKPKETRSSSPAIGEIVIIFVLIFTVSVGLVLFARYRRAVHQSALDAHRDQVAEAAIGLPTATPEPEVFEAEAEAIDEADDEYQDFLDTGYGEGTYTVGADIPEGNYLLCNNDPDIGRWATFYNAPSRDLLDEYDYSFFFGELDTVTIKDGDLIRLDDCTAIPLVDGDWIIEDEIFLSDEGSYHENGYIVGNMIPAGTYRVTSTLAEGSTTKSYAQVWDSAEQRRLELRHEVDILSNNVYYVASGESAIVILEEGQYIYLSRVELWPLEEEAMLPLNMN